MCGLVGLIIPCSFPKSMLCTWILSLKNFRDPVVRETCQMHMFSWLLCSKLATYLAHTGANKADHNSIMKAISEDMFTNQRVCVYVYMVVIKDPVTGCVLYLLSLCEVSSSSM